MSTYRRKHLLVTARQHTGPKIAVNSNLKGNQSASSGDYLVTDPAAPEPKGSIYVMSKADFEQDHELVSDADEPRAAERNAYPDYVSHKEVSAAKIESIEYVNDDMILHLDGFTPVTVKSDDRKNKPQPEAGWYLVVYANGYRSFSPAQAFEEGYEPK